MDLFFLLFRIIHIFAGVFWIGGFVVLFGFLQPAAKATAPAGPQFMQHLMLRQRFSSALMTAAILTVLAGALLYWRDSSGLKPEWITTRVGLGFSLGAVTGILALIIGLVWIRPRSDRLSALGAQIQTAGGPPTPAQAAELAAINSFITRSSQLNFVLLTISLLAMATARYW